MIGKVIAEKYRIVGQLGAGGMGSVWRALHLTLGTPVAIKLIDESIARHPDIAARFEREARAAATLRSPHVVQVLDYGVDDGVPFLAMEMLEGESLEARLGRLGTIPPEEAERVVVHVARAIARAHEAGIVHRDLKPANIFLVKNDDEEIAKVLDFGIAKIDTMQGSSTQTGSLMGTPLYMSPEQARGAKSVDARTDLWALGAIAFECLCSRPPFGGEAVGDIIVSICTQPIPVPSELARVPAGFDGWIQRALARDPNARFQSAKELADALREALRGEGAALVGPTKSASGDDPTRSTALSTGPSPIGRIDPTAETSSDASSARGSTVAAGPMAPAPGATMHAVASTRLGSAEPSLNVSPPPITSGASGRRLAPVAMATAVAIALGAGAFAFARSQSSPSAEPEPYNIVVTARPLAAEPVATVASTAAPTMAPTPTPSASSLAGASSASPAAPPAVTAPPAKTSSPRAAAPESKPALKPTSTPSPKKPKKDDLLGF